MTYNFYIAFYKNINILLMVRFFRKNYKIFLRLLSKIRIPMGGWMAERLKAPVLKTGEGATPSWVRIPLHPPLCGASILNLKF